MRADSIPVSVVQLPPSNIDHEDLAAPAMVSWLPLLNSDNDDDDDGGRRMLKTTILGYLVVTAPSEAQSFTFTELAATDEIPPSALAWSGLGATTVMVIARLQSATFSIVTAATIVASSVQVLPSSSRQLQVLQWMGRVQQSETTGSADLNAPDARQVLEDLKQSVFSTPAQHRLLYALHRSAVSNPFSSNAIQLLGSVSHLNHAIQLALYTIASSVGSGELLSEFGVGSSPIAHECNEGLVSQDMERWLMLALLPFESGAATVRQLLEFRASQLQTARNAAKSALPSAAAPGAKYPTFGGPSGADEASVDANLMELGAMDVDSTSFVALAVEQFDYAKHDPRWVASVGQPMAQSCAEFGRAKLVGMEFSGKTVRTTRAALAERSFDVRRGSHSPTAIYPAQRAVDHDLLTNGLVQRSLRYSGANLARKPVTAEYGAQLQSEADSVALPFAKTDADEKSLQQAYVTEAIAQRDASTPANLAYSWTRTRNAHYPRHVVFPSVSKAGVTPYNPASALALGFPVMHPMPLSVRRNDLAQFTSFVKFLPLDSGLPTDHALAAIAGFEVGDAPRTSFHLHQLLRSVSDHEQAWLQYPRFYSTEMRGLQCVHSLSAAGAMLQVILYGSLGLRYLPTGVRLRPVLPSEDATGLSFRDLKYGSCSFNIFIHSRQVVVVANPARCREKPLLAATIGEAETLAFNPLPLSAPIGSTIVLAFSSDDGKAAAVLARSISVDDSAQLAPHDTDAQLAVDGALTPHGFQPADATNSLALDDDDEERGSDGQSALHVPLDAIMHKHGGIPDGLTAVIVISIIVFHVLLFQLIYREFCRASSATARRRGS
ncbi:hypothetical protein, variant [Capsaspora owczarzaki ATCC 30864]|uniref:Uncharacterized protein n=2 Tax=Capsaspora owczarzaki (strain ATCC 30864) TaxID=595528 RepID=A0A0D2X3B8_CAPO3|nr:hypothetical protein CAOG_004734 [Capsaspora owczarzaki ATCC 30864]KJE94035.1 hypothetical protein, variant [Capsaspora owczarzaki ATCC 30864]